MNDTSAFIPRIEVFNPFKKPFSELCADHYDGRREIVAREVVDYMKGDNAKAVAKCTPCQCCACR